MRYSGLNYTFSAMFEDIARTLGQAVSWHPGSALLPVDPVPSHNQPPVITSTTSRVSYFPVLAHKLYSYMRYAPAKFRDITKKF
jgi:hypothetical protein